MTPRRARKLLAATQGMQALHCGRRVNAVVLVMQTLLRGMVTLVIGATLMGKVAHLQKHVPYYWYLV